MALRVRLRRDAAHARHDTAARARHVVWVRQAGGGGGADVEAGVRAMITDADACWHVWLTEHRAWLRQDERGRAASLPDAGCWTRKDAGDIVLHLGPKKAEMVPDPYGRDAFVVPTWPTAEEWWP